MHEKRKQEKNSGWAKEKSLYPDMTRPSPKSDDDNDAEETCFAPDLLQQSSQSTIRISNTTTTWSFASCHFL